MKRAAVLSIAALLLGAACSQDGDKSPPPQVTAPPPSPTPAAASPTPAAASVPSQALPTTPPRDLVGLARRLRGLEGDVPAQLNATPPDYRVGHRQDFAVLRLPPFGETETTPPGTESVSAVLRHVTTHAYFYVGDGTDVSDADVEKAGRAFEEDVYPRLTAVFGRERSPGIDGDPRITVLHARIDNVGGYFAAVDGFPKTVAPLSNEREMFYLSDTLGPPGTPVYTAVLGHELQHLIQFSVDEDEDTWVNEGLSGAAAGLVSDSDSSLAPVFLGEPDTQLNAWSTSADINRHYGASGLFFRYLARRLDGPALPEGGPESLRSLVATPEDGIAGIRAFLEEETDLTFEELFADWVVANYLGEYEGLESGAAPAATLDAPAEASDSVHQFAADYIEVELDGGDAVFEFDGDTTVPVLPNEPHSGSGQWWANRGDVIDTTLTRELDLTGLSTATLTFWTWFDIERWYDYAYVEASADGGRTWTVLRGNHSTDEDPLAQAYGPAYTGKSGQTPARLGGGGPDPEWVEESMDLTPFAGSPVLLRFEYVTDAGFNAPGWAIDDVAVPELGFFDDAEGDGEWESEGFARLEAPLRQRFLLRLIEVGEETEVTDVALDGENRAEVSLRGFGEGLEKAVLVIAAVTEGTTEPANYTYSLRAVP